MQNNTKKLLTGEVSFVNINPLHFSDKKKQQQQQGKLLTATSTTTAKFAAVCGTETRISFLFTRGRYLSMFSILLLNN